MHAHTRQWHTKKSKHGEWTQWDEAKSGRLNLWAAPMIVQLWEATQYYYYRAVLAIFRLRISETCWMAVCWKRGISGHMRGMSMCIWTHENNNNTLKARSHRQACEYEYPYTSFKKQEFVPQVSRVLIVPIYLLTAEMVYLFVTKTHVTLTFEFGIQ